MLQKGDRVYVLAIGPGVITYVYSTYYEIRCDTAINGKTRLNVDPSIVKKV